MNLSGEWTFEERERVLRLLGGLERTRLSCEASGKNSEVCPELETAPWEELLASLMTGIALGWVETFDVTLNPEKPASPDLHYILTGTGSRAVDAYNRRILRGGTP